VLLLPVQILDREAVEPQRLASSIHQRTVSSGTAAAPVEPRLGLLPARKQQLHLLPSRVDRVVALILVVLQRREVPHAIRELPELLGQPERFEQPPRSLCQGPLEGGVLLDALLERSEGGLPLIPVPKDIEEVPFEPVGNLEAVPRSRGRMGRRGH
jgi:hypothetical protein